MRAVMRWADGREQPTDCGGGLHIITTQRTATGWDQVTFDHDGGTELPWVYVEASRRDATADMLRAEQANRERTAEYMRRGFACTGHHRPGIISRLRTWLLGGAS